MSLGATIRSVLFRIIFSVILPAGIIVGTLYIFNSLGDIKYLPASALAFGVGFYVIFLVFKYWLKPESIDDRSQSLGRYLIVFCVNLAINVEAVYILVSYMGVPLLTAQTVAAVVVAYESYYAYLSLMHKAHKEEVVIQVPKKLEDDIVFYNDVGEKV